MTKHDEYEDVSVAGWDVGIAQPVFITDAVRATYIDAGDPVNGMVNLHHIILGLREAIQAGTRNFWCAVKQLDGGGQSLAWLCIEAGATGVEQEPAWLVTMPGPCGAIYSLLAISKTSSKSTRSGLLGLTILPIEFILHGTPSRTGTEARRLLTTAASPSA